MSHDVKNGEVFFFCNKFPQEKSCKILLLITVVF